MQFLKELLQKYAVQTASVGLFGLAVYQASVGDYPDACKNLALGLGGFGYHLNLPVFGSKR